MNFKSEIVEVADGQAAVELFFERKWTDGLPVVPPTEEAVAKMIEYVGRNPQEVVGEIPPYGGIATIEKLAINSVMAGCRPEYFPVVIATVEACLDPRHNLNGTQTTQDGGRTANYSQRTDYQETRYKFWRWCIWQGLQSKWHHRASIETDPVEFRTQFP